MCTTVCINTSLYLPWLVSQCLKAGVVFKRGVFGHILEAVNVHHCDNPAELIVNCTGLSAGNLGGVEDKNMIPVRGQTVLVRNDPGAMFCIEKTSVEPTYIMQRAAGKNPAYIRRLGANFFHCRPDILRFYFYFRGRNLVGGMLPARQLGSPCRSQSGPEDHGEVDSFVPCSDRREGYRAS